MTTKIDVYQANIPRPVSTSPVRPAAAGAASASTQVAATTRNDRVQLTGDAVQLQQFQKTLNAIPTTDRARVDKIRQSVADGSYQVNPQAIAAKLTSVESSLNKN